MQFTSLGTYQVDPDCSIWITDSPNATEVNYHFGVIEGFGNAITAIRTTAHMGRFGSRG